MTLRARLWFGLVWVLAPLTLFLCRLFEPSLPALWGEYPLADQVQALSVGVLAYPFASGLAAVVGNRLRGSGAWQGTVRRSAARVVISAVGVNVLVLFVLLLAAMMWRSTVHSGHSAPVWILVPLLGAQVVAFTTLGLGLGVALPPIYSIPISLLFPYVAIGFTPAAETPWLRHLWAVSTNCCFVDEVLSGRAIAAHLLALLATTLVGLVLVRHVLNRGRTGSGQRLAYGAAGAAVTLLLACTVASPLGFSPAEARPGAPSCDHTADSELCLWPEHERSRALLNAQLHAARDVSRAVGSTWPTRFTEAPSGGLRWPVVKIEAQPRATAEEIRVGLVGALVPSCPYTGTSSGSIASGVALPEEAAGLAAWWALRLGAALDESARDSEPGQVARSVTTRTDAAQGVWVRDAERKVLAACSRG